MNLPPVSYDIHFKECIAVVKISGPVTFQDVIVALTELIKDGDFCEGMNILYCFSENADLDGTMCQIMQLADLLNSRKLFSASCRAAIIRPEGSIKLMKYVEGLILMLSNSAIEYQAFTKFQIKSACRFVNVSEEFMKKEIANFL